MGGHSIPTFPCECGLKLSFQQTPNLALEIGPRVRSRVPSQRRDPQASGEHQDSMSPAVGSSVSNALMEAQGSHIWNTLLV